MKSIVFIPLLLVCFSANALATVLPATADTTIPKTSLKKAALLKEFGNNDTCRALIEYWYHKRSFFGLSATVSGVAAAGAGIWIFEKSKDDNPGSNNGSWAQDLSEALLFICTFWAGLLLFGIFFSIYLFHPRKKLLRLLTNFRSTGILPKKYLDKIKFRLQQNSK